MKTDNKPTIRLFFIDDWIKINRKYNAHMINKKLLTLSKNKKTEVIKNREKNKGNQ